MAKLKPAELPALTVVLTRTKSKGRDVLKWKTKEGTASKGPSKHYTTKRALITGARRGMDAFYSHQRQQWVCAHNGAPHRLVLEDKTGITHRGTKPTKR